MIDRIVTREHYIGNNVFVTGNPELTIPNAVAPRGKPTMKSMVLPLLNPPKAVVEAPTRRGNQ